MSRLYEAMCQHEADKGVVFGTQTHYLTAPEVVERMRAAENGAAALAAMEREVLADAPADLTGAEERRGRRAFQAARSQEARRRRGGDLVGTAGVSPGVGRGGGGGVSKGTFA